MISALRPAAVSGIRLGYRSSGVACVVATVLASLPYAARAQAPERAPAALPVPVEQLTATLPADRPPQATRTAQPARLAGITTDTGVLRPGHREFATYTTPGLCAAAARTAARTTGHTLAAQRAADATRWSVTTDTLPAEVVALARRCGARFTLENTAPVDLRDLLELRLQQLDEDGARAAAARWLATATTPAERLRVLRETLRTYLAAKPARVGAADSVTLQVRAVIPGDAVTWLTFDHDLLTYADSAFDRTLERRIAERMIGDIPRVPDSVAAISTLLLPTPYVHLLGLALLDDDSAAATRVVAQARTGLARLMTPLGTTLRSADRDRAVALLAPYNWQAYAAGRTTPPLRPSRWRFAAAADTLPPGRPSLLVNIPHVCYAVQAPDMARVSDIDARLHDQCDVIFEHVQRLRARYPASQLAITLRAPIVGYSIVRGRGTLPADEEADWLWWFVHDYVQLPGALALYVPPVTTLPPPDNRRQSSWSRQPVLVLTARDGRTMYESDDRGVDDPKVLDALLTQVVAGRGAPASVSAPAVSSPTPAASSARAVP